jgi:hypothetical protein
MPDNFAVVALIMLSASGVRLKTPLGPLPTATRFGCSVTAWW